MDYEEIFDEAVRVAYATFDVPTDEHVVWVFAVLVWRATHGLALGPLTLH